MHKNSEDIPSSRIEKDNKIKKWVKTGVTATVVTSLLVLLSDGIASDYRKKEDNNKFGELIEKKENNNQSFKSGNVLIDVNDICENNPSMTLPQFIPFLISESESDLKTEGIYHDLDEYLESIGVERSLQSKSVIGKLFALRGSGSYGPYQVKREAIEDYRNDIDTYNYLCEQIANFKLPDKEGHWKPMYEILGYKGAKNMISDIKNHKIDIYKGGGRFGVAYGLVLQNKIYEDIKKSLDMDVNIYAEGYTSILLDKEKEDEEIKKYNTMNHTKTDDLMSFFCMNKTDKSSTITYQYVKDKLIGEEFIAGITSARWCMDPIKSKEKSQYHYLGNLMALNKLFEDGNTGFELVYQAGVFGPSCTKLVNYLFGQNFDLDKENKKAEEYLMNFVYSRGGLDKCIKQELNKYIWNMRTFYKLNKDHVKNGIHEGIDLNQEKFLENNIKASFNHTYIVVEIFKEYLQNKGLEDKMAQVDEMWNNYVLVHDENSLNDLIDIMIIQEKFNEFTGFSMKTDKGYDYFIKYMLGKGLLTTTIVTGETGEIVPVNYSRKDNKHNEVNTIYRFQKGVSVTKIYIQALEIGIPCKYDMIYDYENGKEYDGLKELLRKNRLTRKFLEENCHTYDFGKIESEDDIPDEIVKYLTTDSDGNRLFKENSFGIFVMPDDSIVYFRYNGEDECFKVLYDSLSLPKNSSFISELYKYLSEDSNIRAVVEKIEGHPITKENDITSKSVNALIRTLEGKKFENINRIFAGAKYKIVVPLITE